MSPTTSNQNTRTLDSRELSDAWLDFLLSRQARHLTSSTIYFYQNTAFVFLLWAEQRGVNTPQQITPRIIREYLSHLVSTGKQDTTCHDHARAIKTMVRFFHREGYCTKEVTFEMPKLSRKKLPVLDETQLKIILQSCNTRDRAIVMFLADCGIRNTELCRLNWGDINMNNGLVRIQQGKGQKDRAVVIGAQTRRALLSYRRTCKNISETSPLFASKKGRFTRHGLRLVLRRLSLRTGVHITPHALRRTFVILSLRNNADPGHVQAMLGHNSLDMVYYYAQLENIDLLRVHGISSPIDHLK